MICLVIPILSLLLFIQSLYSLSKLLIYLSLVFFCCFYLTLEHLNTYHYNILLELANIRSKGLTKQLYLPLFKFIVTLHVLRPEPVPIYIYVHIHSWLGLMTLEPKGLRNPPREKTYFHVTNLGLMTLEPKGLRNPPREKTYFHVTNLSAPVLYCVLIL